MGKGNISLPHAYIFSIKKRHIKFQAKCTYTPKPVFLAQISLGWTLKFFLDCNQNNSSSNMLTAYPQTEEEFLFIEYYSSTLKFILKILLGEERFHVQDLL